MSELPTSFSDLPRLALENYREEYRDLSETWRSLDTKAQGLGAIAGIFLAALFAWAREMPPTFGRSERLLVVAAYSFSLVPLPPRFLPCEFEELRLRRLARKQPRWSPTSCRSKTPMSWGNA
jgi:hypothetical protein